MSEIFTWRTKNEHSDNIETMGDYLDNHLSEGFKVHFFDGTYAEVERIEDGVLFSINASGNGDFCNHKVYIDELEGVKE